MPTFRCLIRGENFVVNDELYGFYTTRFIWALNEKEAENKCLEKLKSDEWLQSLSQLEDAIAKVYFERIEKVTHKFRRLKFGKGFSLFRMKDADEYGGHNDLREIEIEAHK